MPRIGALPLATVGTERIRELRGHLTHRLSGKTTQNVLGLLHKALADAVDDGLIGANPVPRLVRRGDSFRSVSDPLTAAEVHQVLDAVPSDHRDLYVAWFSLGWRPSEIVGLRFSDVDFVRRSVIVRRGRVPRRGGLEALPKTGEREVDCSYDPAIFEAFERQRRASIATGARDYVFSDATGRPLSQDSLHKRAWLPTLRRLGMRERGSSSIRDTMISIALSAGADPGWVAKVCGTSEQMIFQHYRKWLQGVAGRAGSVDFKEFSAPGAAAGKVKGNR